MSVIVTDARYRMSLSVIRSLGQAGLRVIAQEGSRVPLCDALGFHSRYVTERIFTASPRGSPDAFVDDLLGLGREGDVLIPVSLASIFAVAARLDEVEKRFRVALAPIESIRIANDTDRLLKVATRVGVRVPQAYTVDNLRFPVVVKYREGEALGLSPDQRYAIIRDADKFPGIYSDMAARQEFPLIQEYIDGDGWGMSAVMDRNSEPAMVFCHRRLREYPVTGGPSCLCESVRNQDLIETGLRLLKELKWQGVAMVEFKREFATGDFVLMEINPRFWGSLPLAAASGANFPLALYNVARGQDAGPLPDYRLGVRMRYLFQDLLSVPGYLRRVPNKAAFLADFVKDLLDPRVVDGVFRLGDPLPGLFYLRRALSRRST